VARTSNLDPVRDWSVWIAWLAMLAAAFAVRADESKAPTGLRVHFATKATGVEVSIGGQVVANYVFGDSKTLRPYFEQVKTPNAIQVTRNHPPVAGKDATDHADMHPGLWLAFGDLAGNDFWRNKGPRVEHERFAEEPVDGDGRGVFAVVNRYVAGDRVICHETARYTFIARPDGYVILWESTLTPGGDGVWLGVQEEMGLGVRVATPITVKTGTGGITNSQGGVNEKGTWGRPADWCDYSGTVDGRRVGVMLVNDPAAERKPWFHSRDYGLLVANPSGPRAGGPERLPLDTGKPLRLRFAVFIHEAPADAPVDLPRDFAQVRELFR
jgi:hypothetical protein